MLCGSANVLVKNIKAEPWYALPYEQSDVENNNLAPFVFLFILFLHLPRWVLFYML